MVSTGAQAVPVQWRSADGGNDHWYELVFQPVSWFLADILANNQSHLGMPGHLATVTSAAENDFIFSLGVAGSIWLGGVQSGGPEPAGGWTWVTGEVWAFTNWAGGEPNDLFGEDHLAFDDFTQRNGTWNDWNGSNIGSGYVIEYSTRIPEPSTLALLGIGLLLGWGLQRKPA